MNEREAYEIVWADGDKEEISDTVYGELVKKLLKLSKTDRFVDVLGNLYNADNIIMVHKKY